MDLHRSISFGGATESHYRGRWRSFSKWANILDSIRYQNATAAVCTSSIVIVCMLTLSQDWLSDMNFRSMEPNTLQNKPKPFIIGRAAFKSSLIGSNTRLMDSFSINWTWMFQTYQPSMTIVSMTLQTFRVDFPDLDAQPSACPTHHPTIRTSDGSGIDHLNPEDLPIPLPSSVGWDWCVTHHCTSLAAKEAQLRVAQANDSIHKLRLALGYKSAIFHTQVRSANSQQKKTCAWNAVKSVEITVHENVCIYSMAHNAYRTLHQAYPTGPDLPQLLPKDLHIATLILGSEKTGQRNKQRSWIWSFSQTTEDNGTWMDDCM
jgi:hypothetical protein